MGSQPLGLAMRKSLGTGEAVLLERWGQTPDWSWFMETKRKGIGNRNGAMAGGEGSPKFFFPPAESCYNMF